jgi:hypothetical protein
VRRDTATCSGPHLVTSSRSAGRRGPRYDEHQLLAKDCSPIRSGCRTGPVTRAPSSRCSNTPAINAALVPVVTTLSQLRDARAQTSANAPMVAQPSPDERPRSGSRSFATRVKVTWVEYERNISRLRDNAQALGAEREQDPPKRAGSAASFGRMRTSAVNQ